MREVVLLLYLFLWVGVFVFIYNKIFTTKCTYDTPIYQNNVLTMCIKSFSIILSLSSCPRDHSIEIINGNYGRFTITLCNNKVTHFCQKKGIQNHHCVPGSPELVGELLPRVRDDPHGWQVQREEVVIYLIYYIANYYPSRYSIKYVLIQIMAQGGAPLHMSHYNLYSKVVLHQRGGVQARTRLLSWH